MKYTIRELEAFSVIGQEVELTNYQKRNIQISTQFWRKFNADLKKSYLSQFGNWIKYAFMIKRNGKLFYFDVSAGYVKGPWYMLMYYSTICHLLAAMMLAMHWRKDLGARKIKVLLEILVLSGGGVVIQLLYHPILTTGFGLSLGILQ